MSTADAPNYLKKQVAFGGNELTLYSIDGITWSTRPQELTTIQDRHENERARVGDFRGRFAKRPETGDSEQNGEGQPREKPKGPPPRQKAPPVKSAEVAQPQPKLKLAKGAPEKKIEKIEVPQAKGGSALDSKTAGKRPQGSVSAPSQAIPLKSAASKGSKNPPPKVARSATKGSSPAPSSVKSKPEKKGKPAPAKAVAKKRK